ncbi:phosducin protein [Salix suchowensis]|nr:phosducin protein [Salix suchowensis]
MIRPPPNCIAYNTKILTKTSSWDQLLACSILSYVLLYLEWSTKVAWFGSVVLISNSDFVRKCHKQDGYAECRVLMKCLEELAVKYPETKFDKIVFIDCVLNYPDYNLPILLVYSNGIMKANFVGLWSFGQVIFMCFCLFSSKPLTICQSDPVLNSGHDGTDLSRDSVIEGVKRRLIEKVVKEHEDTIKSTFIFLPLFFCASVRESSKVMLYVNRVSLLLCGYFLFYSLVYWFIDSLKPRSVYRKIVVEEAYNL